MPLSCLLLLLLWPVAMACCNPSSAGGGAMQLHSNGSATVHLAGLAKSVVVFHVHLLCSVFTQLYVHNCTP